MSQEILDRIADGHTDLVFEYVAAGHAASSTDKNGVSLLQWCSYHGDVSSIKFLLAHGESLQSLGEKRVFNREAARILFKWLNRRSQRRSFNWQGFKDLLEHFDVPRLRVLPKRRIEKPAAILALP